MIPRSLARLARMDGAEIRWRSTTVTRTLIERTRTRLVAPRWRRDALLPALAPVEALAAVRSALSARRWDAAHRELSRCVAGAPRRFAIDPQSRPALGARVCRDFPGAARDAAARGARILAGTYDLLGYRALRFNPRSSGPTDPPDRPAPTGLPDWHLDPVHDRCAPRSFWSTVPYLDPVCGDHKIIWELNRHQHWLTLGRAYWLTGTPAYRDRFIAELESWLAANPPLIGVNWASMLELAFRLLSWVWAINLFADADAGDASPWLVDLLVALDRQLTHVERNLSHYFSPNTHLLGEALALYVTGRALPQLAGSARRALLGRRILLREIDRQIAADGGHCERSTHYHRYALDFYSLALIVARNTADEAATRFEDAVTRLGCAARLLADDHGRMPHIGDDDGGMLTPITGRAPDDLRDSLAVAAALIHRPELQIEDTPEEAIWLLGPETALRNPQSAIHNPQSGSLPETGYYVSRSPAGDHMVIDGGPHGYQNAGHAHADALSLTFASRGVPLLVDPGTGCYTIDLAVRDRMRSTALHNTLTIDDRSQSLPHGPFHWSHVANARVHAWRAAERFDYFDGAHDGYGQTEHRRRVLALHGDLVIVADLVGGTGRHTAAVHWHLDPRWTVETGARGAAFVLDGNPGSRVGLAVPQGIVDSVGGDGETALGWCSPAYGLLDRTTTVRVSHSGSAPFWMVSVFDLDADHPVAGVDWVPVWAEAGALAHAAAIRITRAASVYHVLFAEPTQEGTAVPSYRVGDVETDARMLCYRSTLNHPAECLAIVDGTFTRGTKDQEPTQDHQTCAASRVS